MRFPSPQQLLSASLVTAGAIALLPGSSYASSLTRNTRTNCDAAATASSFAMDFLACSGSWQGNDSNQLNGVFSQLTSSFGSLVGDGVWSYDDADKSDSSGNGVFTSNPGSSAGTLAFDQAQKGLFAVSLKAGNNFSLYLFDGGTNGLNSINFNTLGTSTNNRGTAQGLSHASFFRFTPTNVQPPTPPVTPPTPPVTPPTPPVTPPTPPVTPPTPPVTPPTPPRVDPPTPQPVPEPTSILGVAVVAGLGLGAKLRRSKTQG